MLGLFDSIFGTSTTYGASYPEQLIEKAIERAVDGTDSRLRLLSGYKRKLWSPAIKAIDHVIGLVADIPPPAEISRRRYGADAELSAFFVSPDHMQKICGADQALSDVLWSLEGAETERVIALLLMEKKERRVLGMELEGDILRRDVAQVTVSFSTHRLLDPTPREEDTRRLLQRRAFDHLLELVLGRIASANVERTELEQQRNILQRKLKALRAGRWGFDDADDEEGLGPEALAMQMKRIEAQLHDLGTGPGLLHAHLDILVEVLERADRNLWSTSTALIVDRMGVKHERPKGGARQLDLDELHSANGRSEVMRLVSIAREELPPRRDLLQEARRYLG